MLDAAVIRDLPKEDIFRKSVHFDRSGSFKVIEIGTNRKPVCDCDFLSNMNCVSHRLRDIATLFAVLLIPISFEAPARGVSL